MALFLDNRSLLERKRMRVIKGSKLYLQLYWILKFDLQIILTILLRVTSLILLKIIDITHELNNHCLLLLRSSWVSQLKQIELTERKTLPELNRIKLLGAYLIFDSGNAVQGEAFTPPPPLKKWIKKVVNKPNRLSPNVNEFLAFGQLVFGFLYAHHSSKTNKNLWTSQIVFYRM